jgi:thiol:disulfide interchange protein DsbD
MRKWLTAALILLSYFSYGQADKYIQWTFSANKVADKTYDLHLTAKLAKGYHVFSQFVDGTPTPTAITFNSASWYEKIGKIKEVGKLIHEKDPDPDAKTDLLYFEKTVDFVQRISLKGSMSDISGKVEFQVCNATSCERPDEKEFTISLKKGGRLVPVKSEAASPGKEMDNNGQKEPIKVNPGAIEHSPSPVHWTYELKKLEGNKYEAHFKAKLDSSWHMYAADSRKEGPSPTAVTFDDPKAIKLIGNLMEPVKPAAIYDSVLQQNIVEYNGQAEFVQKFELLSPLKELKGKIIFMACSNKSNVCQRLEENFSISAGNETLTAATGPSDLAGDSLLSVFLQCFLGGFLALITPCMYPMIPLTVSFFTKKSDKDKGEGIGKALLFGLSIILIYVTLGTLISAIFGSNALNALSTNIYFNLGFFAVFVAFGISFLGAFDITLPSSWTNRADQQSEKGGLIGIFFVAFTLALVSFSCTGPIIGSLLVLSSKGGIAAPAIGMLGFSLAMAIPFTLFAIFPGLMQNLPKSGGWLNSVKVTLGFIELALALKFLSNADLAYHLNILKREYFLIIWIVIFTIIGFYLLGKLKLSHDSPLPYISVPRVLLAIFAFAFSLYMIPGLFGAPLNLLSGFIPPLEYREWHPEAVAAAPATQTTEKVKYAELYHSPLGLSAYYDYDQALRKARAVGKPLMIDFTGWACANCRKMEQKVWSDPAVLKILKNDYILVSLYVDEKTSLADSDVYISPFTHEKITNIGDKWNDLESGRYGTSAQPLYVLLDNEEKELVPRVGGYNPDIPAYVNFLDAGKKEFAKRQQAKQGK